MTGKDFIDGLMEDVDRFDNKVADTTYRAIALNWLNRVLKNIATMQDGFHWRFLEVSATFPTVADQLTYSLPTDIDGYKIFDLRQQESDVKLIYKSQEWIDEYYPDPTNISGNPLVYTIFAKQYKLIPCPSGVITMYERYIKVITALTDSAASNTDVPTKWDDVIIQGALAKAYKFDKRLQDSIDAQNQFLAGIERMKLDNECVIDYTPIAKGHRAVEIDMPRYARPIA